MLTPLPESTHFCLGWNVNVEIQSLPQCSLTAETGTNCTLFCLISCHFVCRPIRNLVLSKGTFLAYFYLFTFKITPSSFFFFSLFYLPHTCSFQACIDSCDIWGSPSRINMQSTIILCGKTSVNSPTGNLFCIFLTELQKKCCAAPLGALHKNVQLFSLSRVAIVYTRQKSNHDLYITHDDVFSSLISHQKISNKKKKLLGLMQGELIFLSVVCTCTFTEI